MASTRVNPLLPGTYTVTVTSTGFSNFQQENIVVDALDTFGLNITLKAGSQTETITVSDAPPALDTTNATLGGTIENSTYAALPLLISGGQQRDITQFSNLLPGAQVNPGGRSSIIGGTGQRVGELYVDGLPLTTASQQGDNRPVFNIVPLEAIDQIKVVTSGYSAQYQGAGLENYNLKAGTNKYHGSVFAYVRNTIFDAWTLLLQARRARQHGSRGRQRRRHQRRPVPSPPSTRSSTATPSAVPSRIPHLINGHDKLFFYTTLTGSARASGANPTHQHRPHAARCDRRLQRAALRANWRYLATSSTIPTTQAACTAQQRRHALPLSVGYGQTAHRQRWTSTKAHQHHPRRPDLAHLAVHGEVPARTARPPALTNNFVSGVPSGFDNWLCSGRIDYTISPKQTSPAPTTRAAATPCRTPARPLPASPWFPTSSPPCPRSPATSPTCSTPTRSRRTW